MGDCKYDGDLGCLTAFFFLVLFLALLVKLDLIHESLEEISGQNQRMIEKIELTKE